MQESFNQETNSNIGEQSKVINKSLSSGNSELKMSNIIYIYIYIYIYGGDPRVCSGYCAGIRHRNK